MRHIAGAAGGPWAMEDMRCLCFLIPQTTVDYFYFLDFLKMLLTWSRKSAYAREKINPFMKLKSTVIKYLLLKPSISQPQSTSGQTVLFPCTRASQSTLWPRRNLH